MCKQLFTSFAHALPSFLPLLLQWNVHEVPDTVLSLKHLARLAILFPNLIGLVIYSNHVTNAPSDLEGLSLFRGLRKLGLNLGYVEAEHSRALVQQLGLMTDLRHLTLHLISNGDDVPLDLSPLGALSQLRQLDLTVSEECDLSSLVQVAVGCSRLRHLALQGHMLPSVLATIPSRLDTWPELRTLSFGVTNVEQQSALLAALEPIQDTMPLLQCIDQVELEVHEHLVSLQQLGQQLAALPVPLHTFKVSAGTWDGSPAQLLQALGPMAPRVTTLGMESWAWSCEDVRALAAAAPGLKELFISAEEGSISRVAVEVVCGFPSLTLFDAGSFFPLDWHYQALLSLCSLAQSKLVASDRTDSTLRMHVWDDEEATMQKLVEEWEAKCEGPQRFFLDYLATSL